MKTKPLYVLPLLLISMSGCATLERPEELTWQATHLADTLMTNAVVDDPCSGEGATVTRALIGENPSHRGVVLWGIGTALLHLWVSDQLRETHPRTHKVWQTVTLIDTGVSLYQGYSIGVRIGGPNKTCR